MRRLYPMRHAWLFYIVPLSFGNRYFQGDNIHSVNHLDQADQSAQLGTHEKTMIPTCAIARNPFFFLMGTLGIVNVSRERRSNQA